MTDSQLLTFLGILAAGVVILVLVGAFFFVKWRKKDLRIRDEERERGRKQR